ncbi:MAG: hypothetical protein LBT50_02040 [Prevotellaceae bacterium]|nr:hypothetical protein [Prevotellaceae bacterium]
MLRKEGSSENYVNNNDNAHNMNVFDKLFTSIAFFFGNDDDKEEDFFSGKGQK